MSTVTRRRLGELLSVNLRLTPVLARRIDELAARNERTRSAEVRVALSHWVELTADQGTDPSSRGGRSG